MRTKAMVSHEWGPTEGIDIGKGRKSDRNTKVIDDCGSARRGGGREVSSD